MRIIYDGIIYSLQRQGGIMRYANELIGHVAKRNECTVLMHQSRFAEPPQGENIAVIDCTKLRIPFGNPLLKYALYPFDKWATEKFLKAEKYAGGVFHSTYYTTYRSLSIPQIVTVHDLIHERRAARSLRNIVYLHQKRQAIERADHLICISQQSASDLTEVYPKSHAKISVVPLGVSDVFFEEPASEDIEQLKRMYRLERPFMVFVGRRSGYKNFERCLRAFALSGRNDCDFVVISADAFTMAEHGLIAELKLADRVKHVGSLSDQQMRAAHRASELFVFPSLAEGFGLPLLEALASGATVAASDIAVFHELAGDEPRYVDPTSIESMAAAFAKGSDEPTPDVRARRKKIAEKYRWQVTAEKTVAVYQKVSA